MAAYDNLLFIIVTRKNCHIFHKKRHFRPLKVRFGDFRYRVELSHFPHLFGDVFVNMSDMVRI